MNWETVEPIVVSDEAIHVVDPEAFGLGVWCYRVRPTTDVELFSEEYGWWSGYREEERNRRHCCVFAGQTGGESVHEVSFR